MLIVELIICYDYYDDYFDDYSDDFDDKDDQPWLGGALIKLRLLENFTPIISWIFSLDLQND